MIRTIKYEEKMSLDEIFPRSQFSYEDINEKVKNIIEDVKENGDEALFKYNEMFDNVIMTELTVSSEEIEEWLEICEDIKKEPALERLWNNYRKDNQYASDISFEDVVKNLYEVGNQLERTISMSNKTISDELDSSEKQILLEEELDVRKPINNLSKKHKC